MKKQGKRSKKKHLSKEVFRKMRYKQNMWRVYKHTGKDKDYEVYKEALNAGVKGRDGSAEELDRETGEEQITVGWARRKDGG